MLDKLVGGTYDISHQFDSIGDYLIGSQGHVDWLDTSISYNNDYFIKGWKGNIISSISPCMTKSYEFWVSNHLMNLGKNEINIMLVHDTRDDSWLKLYGMLLEDKRFNSVGVTDVNVSQLNLIKNTYGGYPEWIKVEINPWKYDKWLIDFCRDVGIKVIAYSILGGRYNASRCIQMFTLPYIIQSIGKVADKVIVRWDNPRQCIDIIESLKVNAIDVDLSMLPLGKYRAVPEESPVMIQLDMSGFPIYWNESTPVNTINNYLSKEYMLDFYDFQSLGLNSVDEYQAYLRYKFYPTRIAIVDGKGKLTKVESKGCRIYTKSNIDEIRQ